jgi:hypothetical protein
MKKIFILASAFFAFNRAYSQALPTLEMDFLIAVPPAGPYTTPITIPLSLDALNDNTYVLDAAISLTVSFRNQVFSGLTYSNLSDGITFGGGASLSSGGPVQQSASNVPYDLIGAYLGEGGPKSPMFTSNPLATGSELGTGFDVEGNLFRPNQNGAIQIFTAAQVLYDNNTPKDARVYFGDIVFKFNKPVTNPVLHFAGLGGSYTYLPFGQPDIATNYLSTFFATELEMVNTGLTSTLMSSNPLMTLIGNDLINNYPRPNGNSNQIANEYPIDNYGAMSGSVRINGTVQEVSYKVYLKGTALSDFSWSTTGVLPNPNNPGLFTPLVTNATRNPLTGDIWWVAASLLQPTQQISGNVYIDSDGLSNNDVNKTGSVKNLPTNASDALFVNLINSNNDVIATTPVNKDGLYLFDSVAIGDYSVQLASVPGIVGDPVAISNLPATWVNTGEFIGAGSGSDGNIDAVSNVFSVPAAEQVVEVNFGIQRLPNSDDKVATITSPSNNVIPQGSATAAVSGLDVEDGVLGNANKIEITQLPTNATMSYNNIPVMVGDIIIGFNPSLLSYDNVTIGSTDVVFEYSFYDQADFKDPTPATYELNWTFPLSAIEIKLTGSIDKTVNKLKWIVTADLNKIESLQLYRKVKGQTMLLQSALINGTEYSFDDKEVEENTTYTYFVTLKEKNGKISNSNNIILKRVGSQDVSIFPNPVIDIFTIEFNKETGSESKVAIADINGKIVSRISIPAGVLSSQIDISSFAAGVYNLTLDNEKLGDRVFQLIKK